MANPNYSPVTSTPPVWMGDYGGRDSINPVPVKLDAAQFNAEDAVKVTVTAAALMAATSIGVTALSGPIPTGKILDFGTNKFARLTAAAAAGATTLAVSALPSALAANDTATYKGAGKKRVPSGTLIGRTYAERDAAAAWGPADVTTPDDEIFLTAREVADLSVDNDTELYRHKRVVKENYLPGWAALAANVKAKIRAIYDCIGGTN